MAQLRRLVTGHNKDGRAIVASDEILESQPVPGMDGWSWFNVWGTDGVQHFPNDGSRPEVDGFFAPPGGFRYIFTTMEPHTAAGHDEPTTDAELAGPTAIMSDKPGMHRTASIDTVFVIEGSCILEIDDGVKVQMNAGDTLIQCGAIHAWSNPFDKPCRMMATMMGAHNDLMGK